MGFTIPGIVFLKEHEKLLITVVIIFGLLWGTSSVLNQWEKHDQKKLDQLQSQLDDAKKQVAQSNQMVAEVRAQANADKAASAQMVAAMAAQNASLANAIKNRDAATTHQQQIDLHASIPELAKRFMSLVPEINPADIKVAPDAKTVTIGQDTAGKTVAQLELVPALQQDLKDSQQQTKNVEASLTQVEKYNTTLEKLVAAQDKTIQLQQKQIEIADKTCDQKVKVEKDKGRKSFLKGLKFGTIIGAVGGGIVRYFVTGGL
jgi:predicted  nucleic acid-binding Zn-ribbon protein